MPKAKQLPTSKQIPVVIGLYLENGKEVFVFAEYTPEMGRRPTSQGGWGRFSGVGSKLTTGGGRQR